MPRTQRETTATLAAARRTCGYSSSRPSTVSCFESLRRARARRSDRVNRFRSNRTAAATSGPASEPRPASSAPATKRRSNERSNAESLRPRGLRARLERPRPPRRPVGEEGVSDDPLLRDGAPFTAIGALPTIVAHHKKGSRRNGDLLREVADGAARIRPDERLLLELAVDVHAPGKDLDAIPRHGND